jgi:hypothetical protein
VERTLTAVSAMTVHVEDTAGDEDLTIENGLVRVSRVDAPPRTPSGAATGDDEPDTASQPVASEPTPEPDSTPDPEPDSTPEPDLGPATEAMAPPPPPAPPEAPSDPGDDDHDGMTRTGGPEPAAYEPPGIPGQPPAPSIVSRPVARLVLSNGETVEVDRAVIIGRAPEARRFPSAEQPRLVTVPSPQQEISSTHLEIRPGSGADHGSAVATDLGSTNGTVLVQPGLPPEDLQPGIAVQLIPGAILDLGDGVTIQVLNP